MRIQAALFDLDGTLVDSLGDIADAMNWALGQHGLPAHPEDAYRQFVGEGVVKLVQRAVPEAQVALRESVLGAYRTRYAERLLDRTRPFPGVTALLEALAEDGLALGVLSNKPDAPTQQLVRALFPHVPFRAVYGERAGVPRKPDPTAALALAGELGVAPQACAFVGDTPVDMGCARRAGMFALGVSWGFRPEPLLREAGADVVAHAAPEVLAHVRARGSN